MQAFISRIGRCIRTLKRPVVYGTWIAGVSAPVLTYIMFWRTNKIPDITEENEDFRQTESDIYDLETIVKSKAWELYYGIDSTKITNILSLQKEKKPILHCNWDGVESNACDTIYKKCTSNPQKNIISQLVFETFLKNSSNIDQTHTLSTEVQTSTVCESSVTKGYTKGSEVGLYIPLPNDVPEIQLLFSDGISIKRTQGNSEKREIKWVVTDCVKVPRKSTINVTKGIQEKQIELDFETQVGFKGFVRVAFRNQNQKIIATYDIPVRTIIKEVIPEDMRKEGKDNNDFIYIKTKGRCKFKFTVKQEVEIKMCSYLSNK